MSTNGQTPEVADNRGSLTLHLHGPQQIKHRYYPRGTTAHTPEGYGALEIERGTGGLDVTMFVHDAEQADAIAAAAAELAAKFRADPPAPEDAGPCRICAAQTRYVDDFSGDRVLIHADAGIRFRDHYAELVPAAPATDDTAGE